MKSKSVLITAAIVVIVLTAILFVVVFSMQGARAEQAVPMEEATEEVPAEAVTEDPAEAEVPEKAAEAEEEPALVETEEQPAETPEQPAETEKESADISVGKETTETEETLTAETYNEEVKIGCYTQSQKKVTLKEAAMPNWEGANPSAADISEELALCIAEQAAKDILEWENPKYAAIEFNKDKTGQRGDFWEVQFGECELVVQVDSLSGKVAYAYSEARRSPENHAKMEQGKVSKIMNDICIAEESAQGGEYTAATKAIAEKYIDGKVEKYVLNAVHGTGFEYPLVSIDVVMEDGTVYEFEWAREKEGAEIKICSLTSFPSWEHFLASAGWDVDLILNGGDPV